MTNTGAAAGFFGDQLTRKRRRDAVEQRERRLLVVGDGGALGGIARGQMRERARKILGVGVSLAEREIELHAVGLGQTIAFCRQRFHGGEVRIAGGEFFGIGEIDIDAADVRIEAERLVIRIERFFEPAELFEHVAHVVVGVGEIGLERERAPVMRQRLIKLAALEGDAAHQIDGVVIVRAERQRALGGG